MNRKSKKKLALGRETLKRLDDESLDDVAGGVAGAGAGPGGGQANAGAMATTVFPCFSQNNCPINA